jgi:hypothetical protein
VPDGDLQGDFSAEYFVFEYATERKAESLGVEAQLRIVHFEA